MKKRYMKIRGIHCAHCIVTIQNALRKHPAIREVSIREDIAEISYEGELDAAALVQLIADAGYVTEKRLICEEREPLQDRVKFVEFILILFCILGLAVGLRAVLGFNLFQMIPTIDSSITYGMLVVTGALTSIHCVGMCGAINLTAVSSGAERSWKRPLYYNLGRVLSYTAIGGLVGFLGSVISIHRCLSGGIILLAAAVMFLMSLRMLGVFNIPLPRHAVFRRKSKNSFLIGLLNGWMPCGPLQAMQLYALSTGSMVLGAVSLFLFAIGTVPMMFAVGLFAGALHGKGRIWINKIAATLILVLSVSMMSRGMSTLGLSFSQSAQSEWDQYLAATMQGEEQVVQFDLTYNGYADVVVQKDIPVHMIIHVDETYLTGCNNQIVSKDFSFEQELHAGENEIVFTPTEEGTYTYTCWMGMIKNTIQVIDDPAYFEKGTTE
ncbi:MAG: sulfite exporter TauE/SafE family protein [Eubacteriales bacterium]|nr:sulfite exporter TauE/SafE family protein [Eubacteriales bacterium]